MPEIKLGTKNVCYGCGTKFYDFGKPDPVCPKCGANQNERPKNRGAEPRAKPAVFDDDEEDTPIEDLEDTFGEEE